MTLELRPGRPGIRPPRLRMVNLRVGDRRSPTRHRLERAAATPSRSNAGTLERWNAENGLAKSKPATRPQERGPAEAGPSRMVELPHQPHKIDKFENPMPGAGDGTLVSGSGPKVQPMRRFISQSDRGARPAVAAPAAKRYSALSPRLKKCPRPAAEEVGAKGE